jgi:hypothetical protein
LPSCSGTRILAGYPVVTNYCNILFDVLVHAQDIAIPLGRDYPMPPEAARAGADRVWTMGWPFCARPDSAGSGHVGTVVVGADNAECARMASEDVTADMLP